MNIFDLTTAFWTAIIALNLFMVVVRQRITQLTSWEKLEGVLFFSFYPRF